MIRGAIEFVGEWLRRLVAVPLSLLPRRHWDRFESFPVLNMVLVSVVATLIIGTIAGISSYLHYMAYAIDAINAAGIKVADTGRLNRDMLEGLSALSFFGFLFFTPQGLATLYVVVTGSLRMAAFVTDDPIGDPLLTVFDAIGRSVVGRVRRTWRSGTRRMEEGAEVPDQLVTAKWAGVTDAEYVVISSRQKPGWTRGTIVVTSDAWYRLGVPFEFRSPEGLRTAYPLTTLQTSEVLRRSVRYELPPLQDRSQLSVDGK